MGVTCRGFAGEIGHAASLPKIIRPGKAERWLIYTTWRFKLPFKTPSEAHFAAFSALCRKNKSCKMLALKGLL
jgi:hypothetical protein